MNPKEGPPAGSVGGLNVRALVVTAIAWHGDGDIMDTACQTLTQATSPTAGERGQRRATV